MSERVIASSRAAQVQTLMMRASFFLSPFSVLQYLSPEAVLLALSLFVRFFLVTRRVVKVTNEIYEGPRLEHRCQ